MNWFRPIGVNLFRFGAELAKKGCSDASVRDKTYPVRPYLNGRLFMPMISDDIQGYAAVDGMNECGLVVNAPYDTSATYAKPDPTLLHGNISISN